jgi:hypothetical protein
MHWARVFSCGPGHCRSSRATQILLGFRAEFCEAGKRAEVVNVTIVLEGGRRARGVHRHAAYRILRLRRVHDLKWVHTYRMHDERRANRQRRT